MARAFAAVLLLASCGARTDLGGQRIDAEPACTVVDYVTGATSTVLAGTPFVVDESHVYYLRSADVLARVPKEGGDAEDVITFGDDDWLTGRFVVDSSTIYWANAHGEVFAKDKNGGDVVDLGSALAPVATFSYGLIASNEKSLVVLVAPSSFGLFPKSGGPLELLDFDSPPTGPVVDAYADASRIWWMTGERVYGAELSVGTKVTPYGEWPNGLAVNEGAVYWSTTDDVVDYVAKSSTSMQALSGAAHGPLAVGKDAVFGMGPNAIMRVPLSGGPAVPVVLSFTAARLVTDGSCLYYATTGGKLARVPQ